jgi:hypothetical protein
MSYVTQMLTSIPVSISCFGFVVAVCYCRDSVLTIMQKVFRFEYREDFTGLRRAVLKHCLSLLTVCRFWDFIGLVH